MIPVARAQRVPATAHCLTFMALFPNLSLNSFKAGEGQKVNLPAGRRTYQVAAGRRMTVKSLSRSRAGAKSGSIASTLL
jgi:hypothetical protein